MSSFEKEFGIFNIDEYSYVGVDFTKLITVLKQKEPNQAKMIEDMSFFIMLTNVRGVAIDKIKDKSSDALSNKLRTLIGKYDIVPHKKSVPINQPTIPRMMSLFPLQIYKFRVKHITKLPKIAELGDLPAELAWPGGCAMIKEGNDKLFKAYIKWFKAWCVVVKLPEPTDDICLIAYTNSQVAEAHRV
jgi:hypothetical protein